MMDYAVDGRGNLMNLDKCQMTPHFVSCFFVHFGGSMSVRKSPQYSPLMFCAQLLCTWRHQRFQFPKRFSDSSSCGSIARKTSYTWQTMKRLLLFATTCFKSRFTPQKWHIGQILAATDQSLLHHSWKCGWFLSIFAISWVHFYSPGLFFLFTLYTADLTNHSSENFSQFASRELM